MCQNNMKIILINIIFIPFKSKCFSQCCHYATLVRIHNTWQFKMKLLIIKHTLKIVCVDGFISLYCNKLITSKTIFYKLTLKLFFEKYLNIFGCKLRLTYIFNR